MNCKALARIMPELAAGELNEKQAAEAREHITVCSSCAEELRSYEAALGALSAPREMLELPQGLEVLNLPEKARRPRLRPALASVGAAALLLAAILTLPLFSPKMPKTPERIVVQQVPPKPQIIKPIVRSLEPAKQQIAQQPKHRHRVVRKPYVAKKPKEMEAPAPTPEIVIVSQAKLSPESYSIEIQSTDMASGTTTVYTQSHDDVTGDHSFQMQTTFNTEDTGRT
ncbi:MAG TPA: zf-HC2 domain-containing protein [Armatimonadota bacterium]|nr:zf-HC2 domain-containing protein [Armatimonadota bacterium]